MSPLETSSESRGELGRLAKRDAQPAASHAGRPALGRKGRMTEAIAAIGRGDECFEGAPFAMELA